MKSTSTLPGMLRNLKVIIFILISCVLLTLNNFKSYAQTKNYATEVPVTGTRIFEFGILGNQPPKDDPSGGSITNPLNAATGGDNSFAALSAKVDGVLVAGVMGEAWIQLKYPQTQAAGKTTYIRFDPPTTTGIQLDVLGLVGDLTGLLTKKYVKLEAYSGTTRVPVAQVTTAIVQDAQGINYFAVTSGSSYNSVLLRLGVDPGLVLALGSTINMNVYEAFTLGSASCGTAAFASVGETTGVNVSLSTVVKNPSFSIDQQLSTATLIQTGVVGVANTTSQTVFFNQLSAASDVAKVTVSVPASLLSLGLFNNIKFQAYNGTTPVGAETAVSTLINLDLLTLFANSRVVPVFFTPGLPFDRIKISITNLVNVGGNLLAGGLNVHEVEQTVAKPTFVGATNGAALAAVCGNTVSLNIANPVSGFTYNFYRRTATTTKIPRGSNTTGAFTETGVVTGAYTYYVSAKKTGCLSESDLDSVTVNVTAVPVLPVVTANAICSGSAGIFTVTNAEADVVYNWYTASSGGAPVFSGSSFNAGVLTANATYHVEGVRGTCLSAGRTAATITVSAIPADAELSVTNVIISSGQTATLTATAPTAGSTINWYTASSGGTPIATGATFSTPPLTIATTYFVETLGAGGCVSVNRVPVTVTIGGVVPALNCKSPTAQTNGVEGLLCLLCGVSDPTNAIDSDPLTFSTIRVNVGVAAAAYQRLIFPAAGVATDSIRLILGTPGGLADLSVLGGTVVNVMNGNTVVSTYNLNSGLINLQLLDNQTARVTIPAGAIYDRVELRVGGVVSALTTLNVYSAEVIYPNPVIAATGKDICSGATANLVATPAAGIILNWYATPTGGATLATGNTYSPAGLTASTTYYVEVSRAGCANTDRVPVTVNVNPAIVFAANTLNNATAASPYSKQITAATGGTPAFTYTLAPGLGNLPAGLSLSTTGLITGTPTANATTDYNFSVIAKDSKGCMVTTAFNLKLASALTLPAATLPNGTVSVLYPNQLLPVATGGTGPYTYVATNLPPGLTFNDTTPGISGTPTQAGTYPIQVTVTDANGNVITQNYTIVVKDLLVLPPATLANGTVGVNYPTQRIPEATGGTGPYTYAATGLAPGLTFNTSTREVTGIPTTAGPYTVLVTVTDAEGKTAANSYPVTIGAALVLPPATLADGNVGVPYTPQTIPAATGGTGPYTYAATNLPLDLNFDPLTRTISGTPAQSGLYSVSVTVTDAAGTTATNTYALRVIGALSLPSATLADGTVGTAYPPVILPSVTGGTSPYTYTAANLPAGLNFDPATNTLSGTPTTGGTFTFQITAKDAASNSTTTDYIIKVKVGDPVVASTSTCAGTTATLTPSNILSGVTYRWYGATGNTPVFTGNSFTTPALTANTTYYVEAVSGTAVSNRTAVTITVSPAPALAVVTSNQIISAGQTATLQATAAAGNTISWFANPTAGTALQTGGSFTTPALTANTTYYIETQNASGCVSATRVPVTVTVTPLPTNANCNAANKQETGIDGICLLCGINDPGGSTDADPNTFTTIHLTVGVGANGYQRLIFANPGNAADSIRLEIGAAVGLADVGVLGSAIANVYNGTTLVKSYPLNSTLIHLSLLNPNRALLTIPATGVYDRIEIRFGALVSALNSLDIYGATVVYPNPTVAATGQTTCAGSTTTLTATANGGTDLKWYATANSGTALGTGSTFTTPILNATTTYYIEVSRGNCPNVTRVPVTVTITPAPTAPVLATVLPVCYGSTASLTVSNAVAGLNYNWYTLAAGGTPVFTGATFVTPELTANTIYYVEAISPGCGGSTRTAVPVSVNPIVNLPQVQASATTVNAGQTVILNINPVTADVTYNWYTDANRTTLVYTGPTYVTPALLVNTTYYVEAKSNLTGCLSASLVQVSITVNNGGNPNPVPCQAAISETHGVIGVALLSDVFNPQLAIDNDTQTGSSLVMPVGALGASVYQRLGFGSVSTVGDTVKVLLNTPGRLLSLGLLSNIEIGTLNGAVSNNDAVAINNNLVNLVLLSNDNQALLTFVPTKPFDQVEIRLNAGLAGVLTTVNLNYAQRILVAPTLTVPNQTVCAGQAVTLSVQNPVAAITYKWYDATGTTVLFTGSSYSPTVNANTIFYVSANTATCESYKTKVSVTVTPKPEVPTLVTANIETCPGTNVVLEVKDPVVGVTYKWYDGANVYQAGKDGVTFTITNVTAAVSYSVEASLTSCGVLSDSKATANVTLGNLTPPVITPSALAVASGTPAVLTATSSTAGTLFTWYTDAALTNPVSTDAIFQTGPLTNTTSSNIINTYYVTAQVPGACVSAAANVSVTILPATTPVDAPCEFASVDVNSGVDGVAILTGVFNKEKAIDNDANSASSLVMPVGALGASVYQQVGFTRLSNIGDTVRIRLTSPGKLLTVGVFPALELTTFNNQVSNNDMITLSNPVVKLDLFTGDENLIFSFVPQKQFDGVELRLRSGLVAVLSTIDLNYVQRVQVAPKVADATVSACLGTAATLTVTNPDATATYRWYKGTSTTPETQTGPIFTTASDLAAGTYDYFVTVTRDNCQSAKTKVTVTILAAPDAPVAVAGNPATICPASAATTLAVTAVAGVTYNWYDALTAGTLLAANTASYTTPANLSVGDHDFFVEAVNANSCTSTAARTKITIKVNPGAVAADITVTGTETSFCKDNTATLTATSTTVLSPVFNWYTDPTLAGAPVFSGPVFSPVVTVSTTYYVTVSGTNKCANNAANAKIVAIIVNPPATAADITVNGAAAAFCAGAKATLTATSPGVVNPVFSWYTNAAMSGVPEFTGPVFEPVVTVSTTYYVSVSGDNKCPNLPGTGKEVAITVNTPATDADLAVTGNGTPFCAGAKAVLTASSTTVDNPQFIWYSDKDLTKEVFRGNVYETIVTANTTFYVTVSGDNKCPNNVGNAEVVALIVNTPGTPADITITGINSNYCKGSAAKLTASSVGVVNPVFTWYNDANLTDVAFSGPVFEPVLSATTTYYVTVRGTNRCESTIASGAKIVTITVNPTGVSGDISVAGNTAPFCVGTKALLTATAAQVTSPVFTWYSDAALKVPVANGPVFEPTVTVTTTFYVTVSGSNRCENVVGDAKIVTLIVNPPATASDLIVSGAETAVCTGTPVKLTAASTTVSSPVFTWYTDEALMNAVFTGPVLEKVFNATTTYYVTVKGANKCENLPGTAKVITVTVNPLPEVPVIVNGAGAGICAGDGVTLSVQSPRTGTTYQWYDAATGGTLLGSGSTLQTGALNLTKDYYLLATNTTGCGLTTGRVKVTVIVNVKPAVPSVASAAVNTCSGSTAVLTIANPVSGITYNWYSNPTGGSPLGTGVNFTTGAITTTSTFYAEAATATCTSTSRTAVVVTPSTLPTPPTSVSGAVDPVCSSNTAVLKVNNPDPALTYRWYSVETNGTHIAEGTTFTTPALTATTTYYVGSVNTLTGCLSSSRTAVTITILPKLAAPSVSVQLATANSVTFIWPAITGASGYEVSVDGGNIWSAPSSGITGTTHTINGLKPNQGVTIQVRATGQLACQTSDATTINSNADNPAGNQIFIPNTFTPNNDGKNDVLYVYGNTISKMRLRVYNQWGQFLFESTNVQNGWDGTHKGQIQPNGVYVYQFEAELNDGTKTTKKGTITLLR